MKYNTDNIIDIVTTAFDNLSSELLLDNMKIISKEHFFKEFRTLKIQMPRRSGHTTAAKELLNMYENSLVVLPNYTLLRHSYINDNITDKSKTEIISKINKYYMDGRSELDLVIIDNTSMLKSIHKTKVYEAFINKTKLLVWLG